MAKLFSQFFIRSLSLLLLLLSLSFLRSNSDARHSFTWCMLLHRIVVVFRFFARFPPCCEWTKAQWNSGMKAAMQDAKKNTSFCQWRVQTTKQLLTNFRVDFCMHSKRASESKRGKKRRNKMSDIMSSGEVKMVFVCDRIFVSKIFN